DPVTPDDGATFSWDNGAGAGTIDLIPAGGMINGQGTVSPAVTTTYEVTVDFNGCLVTDQVTVVVDTPPTASNPAAINVQCSGDVPAWNVNVVTDEADDFTTPPAVTYIGDVSDGLTCPETITRTYRVTDGCGNFVDVTQLIIINDTQVPLMNAAPVALAVQCAGDVAVMANLGWTDNCDGAGNVAGNDLSDGLSCPETITRTWIYTDACGNASIAATQTITVNDTQVPVFAAPPANVTVECAGDVPAMINLGWTDNCDGAANVAGTDGALIGGPCGGTITRTWTFTDACGNNATVIQTITVDDTTPPTATNPAPQLGVPPVFDPLQVTDEADNCSVPNVTNGGDVSDGGNCPEIITRTYIVTDDCGNSFNVTQTFTVGDAILPTASNPLPINVECQVNVPATDPTVVTDEADNGVLPIVTWEDDASDGLTCPETILRRYRVTDNCGNFIFVTQTIAVMDITAPIMNAPPAAVAVQCIGDVPAMVDLGYTDNCDAPGTVTGADVSDGLTCPETITRTWTFTDACGNNATETQTITVQDTQVPVFSAPPAALTVECVGDVPLMTDLGWTDNCDGAGNVTGADGALIGGACGGTITRTWTYTDACGNNATVTQTITVDDTTLPTASNPATTTAPGGPAPAADPLVVIDEADNCTVNPIVAFVGEVSDNNPCPETITRTYSITDDCGNTINVTHLIVITDPILPTATAPGPINVECIGDVPANDPLLIVDEADNQGVPVVAFVGDVSDGLTCPETITRTYSVTDVCGNEILLDQIITVLDITNPTATAPVMVNVECIGDVPAQNILDINDEADNCTVNPVVAFVGDVSDGLTCPETITRTYSITDDCGNQITVDQLIIVNDVTNPTATAPVMVNVECIGDVPAQNILDINDEADNCTVNPVVAFLGDVSDGLTCPETITRTYSITDDCGNQITVDQIIIVNDVTLPTASNLPSINVPGSMDVPAWNILDVTTEADNCTVNPVVAFVSDVSDGNVCNGEIITRTYSVTDDCGNQILITQEITIDAVPAPIDAGLDLVICQGELITLLTSNPWNVPAVWSPVVPAGQFDPLVTTTYTLTADNLGCISTDDVTVTVTPLPVVSFSADVLSGCAPLEVTFTNTTPGITSDCVWSIGGVPYTGCTVTTSLGAGLYDVTLETTNDLGCSSLVTYTDYIYVEPVPLAQFTPSQTQMSNLFTEVIFTNNSVNATDYLWSMDDGASGTSVNTTHTFPSDEGGSYLVELIAMSPLGCADTAWVTVNVSEEVIYYVPNTFTPDGDSYNEYFKPIFTSGYDPYDFDLFVFNRWGETIWESHDSSMGWDGTYGADQKLVQDGTYTWRIEFKTTETDERILITGHVNVLR
ncbi:MAG: gliding motility-associated-like protein, partial [Flavobacteriaceae bacterium]